MGLFKNIYKRLTQAANRSAKKQQKKKQRTAPKPKPKRQTQPKKPQANKPQPRANQPTTRNTSTTKKTSPQQTKQTTQTNRQQQTQTTAEKRRELYKATVTKQTSGNERRQGAQRAQATVSKATSTKGTYTPSTNQQKPTGTQQHRGTTTKATYTPAKTKGNERRAGAQRVRQRTAAAAKATNKNAKELTNKSPYFNKGKSNVSATGGFVKTDTLKYGNEKKYNKTKAQATSEYKKKTKDSINREIAFNLNQQRMDLQQKQGVKISGEDWKKATKDVRASVFDEKTKKQINKAANKYGKQVADEKVGKSGTLKSKQLTSDEYLRLQNASRLGGDLGNKALGKELAEKVGSRTAYSAGKNTISKAATGVMQGLAYGDVLHGGVGTYNKNAKGVLNEVKKSKAYTGGYMGGLAGQFMLGGTGKMADAAVKGVTKTGAARSALNIGARKAGASALIEAPMNTMDAAKMARDAEGKIDKKEFAKYMALNTGMSGVMGGAIGGASAKITKNDAKKFIRLSEKSKAGIKLSDDELKQFDKLQTKLKNARNSADIAKADIASEGYRVGKNNVEAGKINRLSGDAERRMAEARAAREARMKPAEAGSFNEEKAFSNRSFSARSPEEAQALRKMEEREASIARAQDDLVAERQKILADVGDYNPTPAQRYRLEEIDNELDNLRGQAKAYEQKGVSASTKPYAPEPETPNPAVLPKDVTKDAARTAESVESVKKSLTKHAPDEEAKEFTEAENKEIADAVDNITTHIYNGDLGTARQLSEELADKHAKIAEHEALDMTGSWDQLKDLQDYLRKTKINPEGMSLKEAKESVGDYDWHILHMRQAVHTDGKSASKNIDDLWGELSHEFPDFCPPDTPPGIERLKKLAELSKMRKKDLVKYERLPDEAVREMREEVWQDIYDTAMHNAGGYKNANVPEVRLTDKPTPKPGEAKGDLKSLVNMGEADLDKEIRGQEKHLENAIKKYGEDSPRVQEIRAHIDEAKAKKDEIRVAKDEAIAERPAYASFKEEELADNDPAWSIPTKDESAPSEPMSKDAIKKADKGRNVIVKESTWRTSLRRLFESSLVGFENLAKANKNDAMLNQINQVQHWKNNFANWIERSRVAMDRKSSGEGLNSIFEKQNLFGKKNIERRNDFVNYLTYKHAIDRLKYDKPVHMGPEGGSLYSKADYEQMIKDIEDNYRLPGEKPGEVPKALAEFQNDIRGYYDDLLQMRVDSGLITQKFADSLKKKYPNYVPTLREGDEWLENGAEGSGKSAFGIDESIKSATGGSSDILDLYQSTAMITRDVIRDAEQNKLLNMYAETLGIKDPAKLTDKELGELPSVAVSVSNTNGAYRISFFRDGQMVTMPVDKQIAKGLRELNGQDFQRVMRYAGKLSGAMRLFKAPITDYNIIFGVRNGMRDIQQAAVNSKSLKHFSANITTAQASALRNGIPGLKKDPWMKSYEATGGVYSSFFQQDKKILEPGSQGAVKKAAGATVGKALRGLEEVNSAIEITPRLAEYIGTIKKDVDIQLKAKGSSLKEFRENLKNELYGAGKELTEAQEEKFADIYAQRILDMASTETLESAARNAADITLNFSRNGVIGKALNTGLVPYFNPSIQGLSKTIRMFTENKAAGAKNLMNFGMKLGVITMAPSAVNEILCRDNRDYQNLATREKDSNFFIPIGDDGKFIKVPKPRENAVLAEPVEYGLRYFFDKARIGVIEEGEYSQWKDLGQAFISAKDNIGPVDFTDNLFSPLVRLAQNKTWYGGSIESTGEVLSKARGDTKNSDIFDDTTSAWAIQIGNTKIGGKKISDITHLSPKKIDDLMDSYLGVIYDLGISQTAETTHGNPVLNQFVKDSVFSNKNGTELWAEFDKANAPTTIPGKVKQKAKDVVLGHSALNINEKTLKAKDWLNQKGYDDITYSDAMNKIRKDDSFSDKQKDNIIRNWKKAQNDMRHDLVYGSKEVSYENDPLKTIAKTVGVDKAMKDYTYTYVDPETGEKKNQHLDAWKAFKKTDSYKKDKEKGGQKFIDFYAKMRWTNGRIGESKSFPSWMTASILAATEKGNNDDLAKSYIRPNGYDEHGYRTDKLDSEYQEKIIQRGKNYRDYGFTQGYYRQSQKAIFKESRRLGNDYTSQMNPWDEAMALSTNKKEFLDGAYYSADTSGKVSRRMNYARCLDDKGFSTKDINAFAKEYDLKLPDTSGLSKQERGKAWSAFDAKVEAAVREKYGKRSKEVQAAVYHIITDDTYHQPFGTIGDYSKKGDTGITDLDARQSSRWGRRGRRRGGWGRGGGGGRGGSYSVPEAEVAKTTPVKTSVGSAPTSAAGNDNVSKATSRNVSYRRKSVPGDATYTAVPSSEAASTSSAGYTRQSANFDRPNYAKARAAQLKTSSLSATNYTIKSNLNDAYRKKAQKLREAARKKHY